MNLKLQQAISNTIEEGGHRYLYFGGTSYLGLATHPHFLAVYQEGLRRYGVNNGTSRSNNIQLGIYEEAEAHAAARFGAGAALILSSGYLAAQLCVQAFAGKTPLYAPGTHPALWQAEPPVTVEPNMDRWLAGLPAQFTGERLILSNALNNLDPERYDFSGVPGPSDRQWLLADDSHGIGLLDNGIGVYRSLRQQAPAQTIVVASMAKALGVDAGIILGDADKINELRKSVVFNGASPPAAAALYAFIHCQELYTAQLQQLQENYTYFVQGLHRPEEWTFIPELPVFRHRDPSLQHRLAEKKILISSFPYPDATGPVLNRVVLNSAHTRNQLDALLEVLNQLK